MLRFAIRLTIISSFVLLIAAFSARMIGAQAGQPVLMWNYVFNNSVVIMWWDGRNIYRFANEAKEPMLNVTWSLDGRMAWVEWGDEEVRVKVWDGWRVITVSEPIDYSTGLIWSQGGHLAWQGGAFGEARIYVWDGEQTTVVSDPSYRALNPHWSPDGRLAWVAYMEAASNRDIIVWDGLREVNITQSAASEHEPHWSPNGQLAWIAVDDAGSRVMRWDGTDATVTSLEQTSLNLDLSWSSDGRLAWSAYTNAGNSDVFVWDGEVISEVSINPLFDIEPEWSTDGRLAWLTVISLDQMVEQRSSEFTAITLWDGTRKTYIYQTTAGVLYNLVWSP